MTVVEIKGKVISILPSEWRIIVAIIVVLNSGITLMFEKIIQN